jgi:hypothetical protein
MAGKDDHPPSGGDGIIQVLETVRLNAPARGKNADIPQMRVFGGDPSEIVPHPPDDPLDLAFGQFGKGSPQIGPGALRDPEEWPYASRHGAAERRRPFDRQQSQHAK